VGCRGADLGAAARRRLLEHPFLALPPPKSTGPEDFSPRGSTRVARAQLEPLARCRAGDAVRVHRRHDRAPRWPRAAARLVVCGGGVHNRQLLARLAAHLPQTRIESSAAHGVDPDQVEAAAFAWLAARTLAGLPGNIPSVTGARPGGARRDLARGRRARP
jgi:anhydro-N-acetylmuramic acid kinase